MLDAVQLEVLGKPTLTIVQDRFARAAELHARANGLPLLPLLVEPSSPEGTNIAAADPAFVAGQLDAVVRLLTEPVRPAG